MALDLSRPAEAAAGQAHESEGRRVALKVVKSAETYTDAALDEARMLRSIMRRGAGHAWCEALVGFHESFRVRGPHGTHVVLVFQVAGPNLLSLIRATQHRGLPVHLVKGIMLGTLRALAFLHDECGIIHTDIKPENILVELDAPGFASPRSPSSPALPPPPPASGGGERSTRTSPGAHLARTLSDFSLAEGGGSPTSPRTPGGGRRKRPTLPADACMRTCKLADLGNACPINRPYTSDIQTRQYRAPEVLLRGGYGPPVDLWSVGCVAFEALTGDFLFDPKSGPPLHPEGTPGHRDAQGEVRTAWSRDEDHLAQIIELLGSFPRAAIRGELADDFFTRSGWSFLSVLVLVGACYFCSRLDLSCWRTRNPAPSASAHTHAQGS
jgi:serine/threonine-protein kinase SRPK3